MDKLNYKIIGNEEFMNILLFMEQSIISLARKWIQWYLDK